MEALVLPSIEEIPLSVEYLIKFSRVNELVKSIDFEESKKISRKNYWTSIEDEILENEVKQYKYFEDVEWEDVAIKVSKAFTNTDNELNINEKYYKTGEDCKKRYKNKNPEIKKTPFEHWEDKIIVEERIKVGNQWSIIAKKIPGRTPCSVKNRWYAVLRHQRWTHPFLYPQTFKNFNSLQLNTLMDA